jgi:hypothetical protein
VKTLDEFNGGIHIFILSFEQLFIFWIELAIGVNEIIFIELIEIEQFIVNISIFFFLEEIH